MKIKDMSNRVNKKLLVIAVIFAICCFSCKNNKEKLNEKTILYKNYSVGVATLPVYESVFHSVNDSMNNWVKNGLSAYLYAQLNRWAFDSLICFNRNSDKCVMALAYQHDSITTATADFLIFFYGVKIKETWYFFDGAAVVLPREMYEKDISKPLSFEKLHEIAMKEVFSGYLIKDEKGNWVINDKFFEPMENKNRDGTYGPGLKTFEDCVMYQVNKNWEKK